jgi:hypothetical protein
VNCEARETVDDRLGNERRRSERMVFASSSRVTLEGPSDPDWSFVKIE